jgi:hypothetical protein
MERALSRQTAVTFISHRIAGAAGVSISAASHVLDKNDDVALQDRFPYSE